MFRLEVKCERNPAAAKGETDPAKMYIKSNGMRTIAIMHGNSSLIERIFPVLASDLLWDPQGAQKDVWKDDVPRPANPDILIAKLRPGQVSTLSLVTTLCCMLIHIMKEIEMELHCIKGIGDTHAKWSPVGTTITTSRYDLEYTKPFFLAV